MALIRGVRARLGYRRGMCCIGATIAFIPPAPSPADEPIDDRASRRQQHTADQQSAAQSAFMRAASRHPCGPACIECDVDTSRKDCGVAHLTILGRCLPLELFHSAHQDATRELLSEEVRKRGFIGDDAGGLTVPPSSGPLRGPI
jgi:hypothetical protein